MDPCYPVEVCLLQHSSPAPSHRLQLTGSNSPAHRLQLTGSNSPAPTHRLQLTSSNSPAPSHRLQLTGSNSPAPAHRLQRASDPALNTAQLLHSNSPFPAITPLSLFRLRHSPPLSSFGRPVPLPIAVLSTAGPISAGPLALDCLALAG